MPIISYDGDDDDYQTSSSDKCNLNTIVKALHSDFIGSLRRRLANVCKKLDIKFTNPGDQAKSIIAKLKSYMTDALNKKYKTASDENELVQISCAVIALREIAIFNTKQNKYFTLIDI